MWTYTAESLLNSWAWPELRLLWARCASQQLFFLGELPCWESPYACLILLSSLQSLWSTKLPLCLILSWSPDKCTYAWCRQEIKTFKPFEKKGMVYQRMSIYHINGSKFWNNTSISYSFILPVKTKSKTKSRYQKMEWLYKHYPGRCPQLQKLSSQDPSRAFSVHPAHKLTTMTKNIQIDVVLI